MRLLGLLLFLPATLFAQPSADLELTADPLPEHTLRSTIGITFYIHNHGPDVARGVRLTVSSSGDVPCSEGDPPCTMRDIEPSRSAMFVINVRTPPPGERVIVTGVISAATADPNPNNNFVTVRNDAAGAELGVRVFRASPFHAATPTDIAVVVSGAYGVAKNVVVTVHLPEGTRVFEELDRSAFTCDLDARPVVCRAAELDFLRGPSIERLRLRIVMPAMWAGRSAEFAAEVTSDTFDAQPQNNRTTSAFAVTPMITVTSTADDGPGSLREAILGANRSDCDDVCIIGFAIEEPLPEEGWHTIRPQSPLPPLAFRGILTGPLRGPDLGKLVMIDGSALASGDGLLVLGEVTVRDLAIGNFPHAAIHVNARSWTEIRRVYLGVDPGGERAAPNLRGIADVTRGTNALTVESSVIGSSQRTGITVHRSVSLAGNRIGVAANSDAPLPNGASGVYSPGGFGIAAIGNVIANSGHAAIAMDAVKHHADIRGNRMFGNGFGIDYGLDGQTPNVADDANRFPNSPTIEAARYDPATDQTTIRVRHNTGPGAPLLDRKLERKSAEVEVEVFASRTADGGAERRIGGYRKRFFQLPLETDTGDIVVSGDLRGQWISAITIRTRMDQWQDVIRTQTETSEIGPAVMVE